MDTTSAPTLPALVQLYPLLRRITERKGQFVSCLWIHSLKSRKGVSALVTKEVRTTVRSGIIYDNRESVQLARTVGSRQGESLPPVNAGLPWGEWLAFPYVIGHKGAHYVRLYPVLRSDGAPRKCKVIYRENGARITRERAQSLCLASEFGETTDVTCYTLRLSALRRVR
jgi:hypothetical protein